MTVRRQSAAAETMPAPGEWGARYPGLSESRCISDGISHLLVTGDDLPTQAPRATLLAEVVLIASTLLRAARPGRAVSDRASPGEKG
jgi:hypothetical protein